MLFVASTIFTCLPAQLRAQNDGPPPAGTPMYTLHVYTNLVQIPTMVLNQDLKPLPLLNKDQFSLSLDDGPRFRPTQIHLEGEDPIVLAILLDASGTEDDLIRNASTAIAGLSSHALTARDRVALFAFDCTFAASPYLLGFDPVKLRTATEDLLKTPGLHGPKSTHSSCYHQSPVLTSIASVANAITRFSGRRAIVAVTDALDRSSKIPLTSLQQFAVNNSVPIFAVDYDNRLRNPLDISDLRNASLNLQTLTSGTGGLILQATPRNFSDTLRNIVSLLRGRYIIEFPRPSNATTGSHIIDVKVPKRDAVIRTAGVSVPLPGDKELNDPDNVPSDPTRAPTAGTQKRNPR